MPDAVPPPAVAQPLPADRDRPGEMTEKARQFWLVPAKAKTRAAPDCARAQGQEIVVCAPAMEDGAKYLPGPPLPDPPTTMEEIRQKLDLKIGPADIHPTITRGVEGSAGIGVTVAIKF